MIELTSGNLELFGISCLNSLNKSQIVEWSGIKEDPVSATRENPKTVETIVPIQMTGRERRSRSWDRAANPFIDEDDISKNKGEVTKLSNGQSAPLAKAEVIIKKMLV